MFGEGGRWSRSTIVDLSALDGVLAGGAEGVEDVVESLSARAANWLAASSRLS